MANLNLTAPALEAGVRAEPLGDALVADSLEVRPLPHVDDPRDKRYVSSEGAAPPVLLPYQQRWVADPARVKTAEKSRRIGLTWGEAADDVLIAAEGGRGGQDVFYMGYNQSMTFEYVETAANWTRAFNAAAKYLDTWLVEEDGRQIQVSRIRYDSGNKIVALSSRPENLRGMQGVLVLDETAFHKNPGAVLKAGLAFLIWGGKVRMISTHLGADNPFNELVTEIRAGKKPYSLHRITFADALRDGLYQRICRKLGEPWSPAGETAWRDEIYAQYGDSASEELDVIPAQGTGAFLPITLLEARMEAGIPLVRLELPSDWTFKSEPQRAAEIALWCEVELRPLLRRMDPHLATYFGQDVGRSGDLSAIWPLQVQRDMVRRTAFVLELRNVPFSAQEQILWFLCDGVPRFSGAKIDATGIGAQLAENTVLRYGAMVEAVKLNETWYREHVPVFKGALEDGDWVLPRHVDIITDLRAIKLIHGVPKIDDRAASKGSDGKQRHADTAIAAVLADAASRGEHVAYGYTPAARRSSFDTDEDRGALGFSDGAGGARWRAGQRGY